MRTIGIALAAALAAAGLTASGKPAGGQSVAAQDTAAQSPAAQSPAAQNPAAADAATASRPGRLRPLGEAPRQAAVLGLSPRSVTLLEELPRASATDDRRGEGGESEGGEGGADNSAAPVRRERPFAELASWGTRAPPGRGTQIVLADGGRLRADWLAVSATEVTIGRDDALFARPPSMWARASLRRAAVTAALIAAPDDALAADQLERQVRAAQPGSDQLWLLDGNVVSGELQPHGAGQAALADVALKVQGQTVKIRLSRVQAVVFAAAVEPPRGVQLSLGWEDGSQLRLLELEFEATRARLTTAAGALTLETSDLVRRLCWLEPSHDRSAWLSEIPISKWRHVPVLSSVEWPPQAGRNVLGGPLQCRGRFYERGVGVHSASSVTYQLPPGAWRRLAAELAVDAAGPRGSVRFRVYLRGAAPLREVFRSDVLRGGAAPQPISVDLAPDDDTLMLIVEFADDGDLQDYANWLEPRLEK